MLTYYIREFGIRICQFLSQIGVKRRKNLDKLIIELLVQQKPLPQKNHNHVLIGN